MPIPNANSMSSLLQLAKRQAGKIKDKLPQRTMPAQGEREIVKGAAMAAIGAEVTAVGC